jgi:hypothetical protein
MRRSHSFVLAACLLAACAGAPPARPNLPPPEYEEPAGVLTGATSIVADAAASAAPAPSSSVPAPAP